MIYVEPQSGLCNRMRVLDSAVALAAEVQRPLTVIWQRNEDLNCPLGDLFQLPPDVDHVVEGNSGLGIVGRVRRGIGRHGRDAMLRIRHIPTLYLRDPLPDETLSAAQVSIAKQNGMYIRTCHRFFHAEKPFASLRPTTAIMGGVSRFAARLERSVGVHIRRTDHAKAIKHSPLEAFVAQMKEELKGDPGTQFFVATDSPESFQDLRGVFGDAVYGYDKPSLQRSDPKAIIDAAIDLYCLAHCRKLIGSYWSSFSEVAWQLRGIDKVIVRRQG